MASKIAEGSQLLGAEGVFWRLCAIFSSAQLAEFAAAEARRGTPAEQVMEGVTIHIAKQVATLARQTDQPLQVAAMLVDALVVQVGHEINPPPRQLPGLHYPMPGGAHG